MWEYITWEGISRFIVMIGNSSQILNIHHNDGIVIFVIVIWRTLINIFESHKSIPFAMDFTRGVSISLVLIKNQIIFLFSFTLSFGFLDFLFQSTEFILLWRSLIRPRDVTVVPSLTDLVSVDTVSTLPGQGLPWSLTTLPRFTIEVPFGSVRSDTSEGLWFRSGPLSRHPPS